MEISTNTVVDASHLALEDGIPSSQAPTAEGALGRIQGLISKLWNGAPIRAADQEFLQASSQANTSWGGRFVSIFFTPADENSVAAINSLSERIIAGRLSNQDALRNIHEMLAGKEQLSQRELAGVSKLLIACQRREPDLATLIPRMERQAVYRDELIPMLNQYNHEALPKLGRAGDVVARVHLNEDHWGSGREATVQYNRFGYLELVDGAVAPMDLSAHQTLSSTQVDSLKELYADMNRDFHYNNLGLVLEFAHFCRGEQARGSRRTMSELYEAFQPDMIDLDHKYRSGTCGVLAKKLVQESATRLGIHGQCISHFTENNWTVIPIPGSEESPIKWIQLTNEVKGFDHTDAVFIYKDETGKDKLIKFACSLEKNYADEVVEYPSTQRIGAVDRYFSTRGATRDDPPNRTLNDGEIAKTFLKGRFKAVMMKDGKILGIDFLRENLYLNKSWSDKIPGIPKNSAGMVSIDFQNLAQPDASGSYFVDGKEVRMTHREALRIILSKAEGEFDIPADMEEGIIQLVQMAPAMAQELYIRPLGFIKENYPALKLIGKKLKELRPDINKPSDPEQAVLYQKMNDRYGVMIDHLLRDYNPVAAKREMESIIRDFITS